MNVSDFRYPEAGEVVRTIHGYDAFVPSPLPPALNYDATLVVALSQADTALGELSGLGRGPGLPNPHLLIAPYIRREAVLSSRIEGTRVSLAELLLDEVQAELATTSDERREVRNYVVALEHGRKRLQDGFPLSLRFVRELHERLMQGVRGEYATPGEFRRSQNWIGPAGSTPMTAPYVPPPPDRLIETLDAWERFLHVRGTMPDLIQCALIHEQFEAIHPFLDGNGRVGRLLIPLFLIERGRLAQPLLYLSAFIEDHRQDYYDLLQRVRTHGDWSAWLHFFLAGVVETARAAVRQASALLTLREHYRGRLQGKATAQALVEHLFMNPYVTIARAAHLLGVSTPTATRAVALLEERGILVEITGRSWGRTYVAGQILAAIEHPPTEADPNARS